MNSVRDFLIPLLSDGYMTDTLHLDLPTYPSAYMAVITLFLTGVAMGIAGWFGDKVKTPLGDRSGLSSQCRLHWDALFII